MRAGLFPGPLPCDRAPCDLTPSCSFPRCPVTSPASSLGPCQTRLPFPPAGEAVSLQETRGAPPALPLPDAASCTSWQPAWAQSLGCVGTPQSGSVCAHRGPRNRQGTAHPPHPPASPACSPGRKAVTTAGAVPRLPWPSALPSQTLAPTRSGASALLPPSGPFCAGSPWAGHSCSAQRGLLGSPLYWEEERLAQGPPWLVTPDA